MEAERNPSETGASHPDRAAAEKVFWINGYGKGATYISFTWKD
jgi:hypothetical protein